MKIVAWDESAHKEVTLAEANFKNGGFTIKLPQTVDAKFLEKIGNDMPKQISVSNKNAQTLCISSFDGFDSSDRKVASFYCEKGQGNNYSCMNWFYTDSDLTISGSYTRTGRNNNGETEYTETYSLVFKKGWNIMYEVGLETKQGNKYIEKYEATSNAVLGLKWIGEE